MKLTQKQTELMNNAKRLEKEYGAGNIFYGILMTSGDYAL